MINSYAVIIQYLKTKTVELGVDQIASNHRFNEDGGWAAESTGIQIRASGGPVDIYSPVQVPTVEVRIYAIDHITAAEVFGKLHDILRATSRVLVSLPDAGVDGLLQYLLPSSAPSFHTDADIHKDFLMIFLTGMVSETAVP